MVLEGYQKIYERLEGMALTLRKQPGKTLLVVLAGTSLVLFFLSQSDSRIPLSPHPAHLNTPGNRRIQDFRSPEYTAPGDTGGGTATGTGRDGSSIESPNEPVPDVLEFKTNGQNVDTEIVVDTDFQKENQRNEEKEAPEREYKVQISISSKSEDDTNHHEVIGSSDTLQENNEVSNGSRAGMDDDGIKSATPKPSYRQPQGFVDNSGGNNPSWIEQTRPGTKQGLIDSIIDQQRRVLAESMKGYEFHRKLKASKMEDLVLEKGGQPIRSLVITTWRSGSTFIGDVLQSHPATYYHYEPLLDFGIYQARSGDMAQQAIRNIRHLLTCNYTDMDHYLEYGPSHPWLFLHNERLWHYCTLFPQLCWDKDFLSPFCSLFPFQSLKTVRLRLNLTREFLQDKSLGVQVLLLVRDPRGTMQSRRHRDWCPGNPDCDDPAKLCNDLVSDYNTAIDFRRKFPHSFRVVRYEDLSFNAYNMTKNLFDFFHLSYHPKVQEFLDTHTKQKIGGVSSTFRDSKTAPIHWQQDLSWKEVEDIQKVCSKALKLLGYEIAKSEEHLRSFMPIGTFKFR